MLEEKTLPKGPVASESTEPRNITDLPDDVQIRILKFGDLKTQTQTRQTRGRWCGYLHYIQIISGLVPMPAKWVLLQLVSNSKIVRLIGSSDDIRLKTLLRTLVSAVQQRVREVFAGLELEGKYPVRVKEKIINQSLYWEYMHNPLHKHILVGNTAQVVALLRNGEATPTSLALELAAEFGDDYMIVSLRAHGANPTPRAVEIAAKFGNSKMVHSLLTDGGATPTTHALELAAEFGDNRMISSILGRRGVESTKKVLRLAAANAVKTRDGKTLQIFLHRVDATQNQMMRKELQILIDTPINALQSQMAKKRYYAFGVSDGDFILDECRPYDASHQNVKPLDNTGLDGSDANEELLGAPSSYTPHWKPFIH